MRLLRDDVIPAATSADGPDVSVTGFVAVSVDFSEYLGGRSFLFFGVVLAMSFVLLMAVFRSLLVPLKAVILNMLSIAGAYGIVVAIFQWSHFGSLTGIERSEEHTSELQSLTRTQYDVFSLKKQNQLSP